MNQVNVTAKGNGQELQFKNGQRAWFHNFWLRENCHCEQCFHQEAWERLVDFLSIPTDIKPSHIKLCEEGIHLTWPAHAPPCNGTFYSWEWLSQHRTERDARLARKTKRTSWKAGELDLEKLSMSFADIIETDAALLQFLEYVDDFGVGLVRHMPDTHEALFELTHRITFLEESHFGRDFEVASKPNPENLAYTSHALMPHNDLPSRTHLPGIQYLRGNVKTEYPASVFYWA
ncbi:MAG: gamma-butyrobetaine hydroxylase-like domain-containing protein, partial [Pseudomonadota bacterium]